MIVAEKELTDDELAVLDGFLARVEGGRIPNIEVLDGFFAALACCPDLVMPSEYLAVIQSGRTEDDDLVFADMAEVKRFTGLVMRHWNHVTDQLRHGEVYLPLLLENDEGKYLANDWTNGFLSATHLSADIWGGLMNDEEHAGPLVPIMALAYENHPDPELRPFDKPVDDAQREGLLIGAAAGVMRLYAHFLPQRDGYLPKTGTAIARSRKIGRNEPCPCGSGQKYKKYCGSEATFH
jgi:uncharacterized protein